jgi:anti-anti-sigma factor
MSASEPLQDILVAPAQMTVGSLDDFRLEVISAVTRATAEATPHVSVDLRPTQTIDATGLGVLLLLHKRAREKSLKVRLLGPSPSVLEVLRNTRVHLLFEIVAPGEIAPRPWSEVPAPSPSTVDPHASVTYPGLSNPFESPEVPEVSEGSMASIAAEDDEEGSPISGGLGSPAEAVVDRTPIESVEPAAAPPPAPSTETPTPIEPRRCPDCGRALPADREVQFCPWCGTGDRPAATERADEAPSAPSVPRLPARPPRQPRQPRTSVASVASVVIPPPPAIFPRRDPMAPHSDDFRSLLDATELYHRIDEDGDARIIFPLESGRTQTAWITRNVDTIGEYAFRYVMSFVADAGEIAGNFALMGSLLEQVSAKKGGGLVTRGSMLLYRMPVSTQASPESLAGAVALAAGIADELETSITGEA